MGNRLTKSRDINRDGGTFGDDEAIDYAYDNNDRLLTETKDVTGTTNDRHTVYGYSSTEQTAKTVHNGLDDTGAIASTTTYTYDLQGRLDTATIETRDGAGNVVKRETSTYDYAVAGATHGLRTSARRTVETDHDANPATPLEVESDTQTEQLVDENNPTGYGQVLEEEVTDLVAQAMEAVRAFTLGLRVLTQATAGSPDQILHLLAGAHGSTRAVADALAAVLEAYHYDAYGNLLDPAFAAAAPLASILYTGEQFDAMLGQYYLRARYYDPGVGRFGRFDPLSGFPFTPQSLHRFTYANGNPINLVDPSGLVGFSDVVVDILIRKLLISMVLHSLRVGIQRSLLSITLALGIETVSRYHSQTTTTELLGLAADLEQTPQIPNNRVAAEAARLAAAGITSLQGDITRSNIQRIGTALLTAPIPNPYRFVVRGAIVAWAMLDAIKIAAIVDIAIEQGTALFSSVTGHGVTIETNKDPQALGGLLLGLTAATIPLIPSPPAIRPAAYVSDIRDIVTQFRFDNPDGANLRLQRFIERLQGDFGHLITIRPA